MDKAAILRILLALASLVKLFGVEIPEELLNSLADVFAGLFILWATWKDNPISKRSLAEKQKVKELREQGLL